MHIMDYIICLIFCYNIYKSYINFFESVEAWLMPYGRAVFLYCIKIKCYNQIATHQNIYQQKFAFGKNAGFDRHTSVGVRCVAT